MQKNQYLSFDLYRLDLHNECVWRGKQALHLTTKAFAVLHYLMEHTGQLVTKEELFQAIWPDIAVSDAALTICISEIRKVLRDTAQAPRFIATVHRRGYRFMAPVTGADPSATAPPSPPLLLPSVLSPLLVGREAELTRLRDWLEQAQSGKRQIVFVTGEAGIGKTTVVDAFLASVAPEMPRWVGRGQCLEHHGAGEAYLPVLDALGRLCRGASQERFQALLGQYAPTWVLQMPTLLSAAELEAIQRRVVGVTRERMLRELAEAVDAITAEQPLVLILEDLHWSDHATLDLVTWLAQRREPARFLLLGTYRPVEAIVQGHPLPAVKQALTLRGQGTELRLELLSEAAVGAYLAARFPGYEAPPELIRLLHQHTDGHPLFLVQVVEAWVQQGWVQEVDSQWTVPVGTEKLEAIIPENVRQMIEQQFDGLGTEEQRLLEAASVVGMEFSVAAGAAGVEEALEPVEEGCEALVRRGQFLRGSGVEAWPDGTIAGRYEFLHALYQQVVYDRLPVGRRMRLHRRIGERLAAAYGQQAGEIAAALAVHFERGRDAARAAQYLCQAGENAMRRHAYHEAITLLTHGLALLRTLSDTPERARQELTLHIALGAPLIATKGYAASDVERVYTRARELCQEVGETSPLFPVLTGLWMMYSVRGELQTARDLAEQLLALAQRVQDPIFCLEACSALGISLFWLGEIASAWEYLEQGSALYNLEQHGSHAFLYGVDSGVGCLTYGAWSLWLLGYPDQALARSHQALTLASKISHPFSMARALNWAAMLHQFRRETEEVQARVQEVIALSNKQGFPHWLAQGMILQGRVLADQGQEEKGIVQMRQALTAYLTTRATVRQPYYLALLAEPYERVEKTNEGLTVLTEALTAVHQKGEHWWESELHRLRGELQLRQGGKDVEAEGCFHQALTIARRQQAKSLELRAAMSLSRLWQQQRRQAEVHELLAPIYGWFTEGFDTADLTEARMLLDDLG